MSGIYSVFKKTQNGNILFRMPVFVSDCIRAWSFLILNIEILVTVISFGMVSVTQSKPSCILQDEYRPSVSLMTIQTIHFMWLGPEVSYPLISLSGPNC